VRVLIAGNSQAICLKAALGHKPGLVPENCAISFAITPGATGPYMIVSDGLARMTRNLPDQPTICVPEDALAHPVTTYDAIIVSAVGYVDGGFLFDNPITRQGVLLGFDPRDADSDETPVSDSCYRQIVRDMLSQHNALAFLKSLRHVYAGRILIQQFPYLSEGIRRNPDWRLSLRYADPEGMHAFLCETAGEWLNAVCREYGAELIAPPEELVVDRYYTAMAAMFDTDCMHPKMDYGTAVLKQVAALLAT
jgi:hypothetical protein